MKNHEITLYSKFLMKNVKELKVVSAPAGTRANSSKVRARVQEVQAFIDHISTVDSNIKFIRENTKATG